MTLAYILIFALIGAAYYLYKRQPMSIVAEHKAFRFVQDGGLLLAVTAASASQAVKQGYAYRITAILGSAYCSFQGTASAADGGFDFVVSPAESIVVVATSAALHAIEAQAQDVTLLIQEIDDV